MPTAMRRLRLQDSCFKRLLRFPGDCTALLILQQYKVFCKSLSLTFSLLGSCRQPKLMLPLPSRVLPWHDPEIDLTRPLALWAHRDLCRGLIEIQFLQIELIAALRAFVYALPIALLTRLWRMWIHLRLELMGSRNVVKPW